MKTGNPGYPGAGNSFMTSAWIVVAEVAARAVFDRSDESSWMSDRGRTDKATAAQLHGHSGARIGAWRLRLARQQASRT